MPPYQCLSTGRPVTTSPTAAYAQHIPAFTAGGRREADMATPTRELVLFPSTERATPTPENTATTRPTCETSLK
jgi:hypothetical protein